MSNRSVMLWAAVIATATFATAAKAGVTFSYQLIGTAGGVDEYELDVASLTGADNVAANGISSLTGSLTATTGNLVMIGTTAAKLKANFGNSGANSGPGGGTTWFNFDNFATAPVFNPATTAPTSVTGWAMFTDPGVTSDYLTASSATQNSLGFNSNMLGEVYITHGAFFNLTGQYNTTVTNSAAFTITNAPVVSSDISLSAAPTHTQIGTINVQTSGPNNYVGSVVKLAPAANSGSVAISDIGNQGDGASGTEVLLWLTPGFNAGDEAALQADLGTAGTIKTFAEWADSDATRLLAAYTDLGTAAGLSTAPTFLVRFNGVGTDGHYNDFFNFTLPNGDTLAGVSAVPEPASLGLLALGGLGLIARRRSSKR